VSIPGFFETASKPLTVPAVGGERRAIVNMPKGFEYVNTKRWRGTHSLLDNIEHTEQGLIA